MIKKTLKNRIFLVIVTIILSVGTTVFATIVYNANQISYYPSDTSWNVSSVDVALNSLYDMTKKKNGISSIEVIGSLNMENPEWTQNTTGDSSGVQTGKINVEKDKIYAVAISAHVQGGNIDSIISGGTIIKSSSKYAKKAFWSMHLVGALYIIKADSTELTISYNSYGAGVMVNVIKIGDSSTEVVGTLNLENPNWSQNATGGSSGDQTDVIKVEKDKIYAVAISAHVQYGAVTNIISGGTIVESSAIDANKAFWGIGLHGRLYIIKAESSELTVSYNTYGAGVMVNAIKISD